MKKIVLIEDNFDVRENIAEILALSSYEVITAPNGKQGVELVKQHLPDLIICDIMMPELDGYGVLHILGKSDDTANIPFVFLTAKAERSDLRKGMMMGADDYLTKPFDDVDLLNVVEMRIRKSEALRKDQGKGNAGFAHFMDSLQLNAHFKDELASERNLRKLKKGDPVYSAGSYPHGLFYVKSGVVKTYLSSDDGKEFITSLCKEGDFLGYIALLEDKPYTDSAQVMEAAELVFIPKEGFHELVFNSREVSRKFLSLLSGSIQEKEEQLIRLAYHSVRKRVAEALLTLSRQLAGDGEAPLNVSREDLANIAGTATETAIRTLADFKAEELIEIDKGQIRIVDLEKLKRLKN